MPNAVSPFKHTHHESPALRGRNLSAQRGDRLLFSALDLDASAGQALFVTGGNGAGKTTLLRMLGGLTRPVEGEIRWGDKPIRAAIEEHCGDLLYIGHRNGNKDELNCLENLSINLAVCGSPRSEEECLAALELAGLGGRHELPVRFLSQGQQRRLALARLALAGSRLWILDEPFTALDTSACGWVCSLIDAHLESGGVAVLTSHQALELNGEVVELRMGPKH